MVVWQGITEGGTAVPVQITEEGKVVAIGESGPTGPIGPEGPPGAPGPPGSGIPSPETGTEGDVLTLQDGIAVWAEPTGGGFNSVSNWMERTTRGTPGNQIAAPNCFQIYDYDISNHYALSNQRLFVEFNQSVKIEKFEVGTGDVSRGQILIFELGDLQVSYVLQGALYDFQELPELQGVTINKGDTFNLQSRGDGYIDPSGFKINGELLVDPLANISSRIAALQERIRELTTGSVSGD